MTTSARRAPRARILAEGSSADFRHALRVARGEIAKVWGAVTRAEAILLRRREELDALTLALLDAGELTLDQCRSIAWTLS